VEVAECGGRGMRRTRNVEDAECGGPGMWRTRIVEDGECGGREIWRTRNVEERIGCEAPRRRLVAVRSVGED
jgi:hypothetical protein